MTKPIIALDRDGVINVDSPAYIKSPDEWHAIAGSLEAIARLSQAGFPVFVLTNQSGVGRGLYTRATLSAIHAKMQRAVMDHGGQIAHIFYCPHTPLDRCDCRKPKAGLFDQLMQYAHCQGADIIMVGDSLRDLQAANTARCQKTVLVKTGHGQATLAAHADDPCLQRAEIYDDLAGFVHALLGRDHRL